MSTMSKSETAGSGYAYPATNDSDARIVRVETRLLEVPLGAARGGSGATQLEVVHAIVTDSDGAAGTGFTYNLGTGAVGVLALIDRLHGRALLASSTSHWDRIWHELRGSTHRMGRGASMLAVSALDIAVWDLRGRRVGRSLAYLLGAHRDSVPVYGSGRATHTMSDQELVDGSATYVAEGYRAVKLRVGVHGIARDVARVAAVRAAVGDDVDIMVDCNERYDFAGAKSLAERLAPLGVTWLEEPLPAGNVHGHRLLSAASPIPIAAGEHLQGREQFAAYVAADAASILMPDAPITGGVSEWMRIAVLADANGLQVSPHFLPELHVHLAAATPSITWIEHFPLIDDLLQETLSIKNGHAAVPVLPGHGIAWDTEAVEFHTKTYQDLRSN